MNPFHSSLVISKISQYSISEMDLHCSQLRDVELLTFLNNCY